MHVLVLNRAPLSSIDFERWLPERHGAVTLLAPAEVVAAGGLSPTAAGFYAGVEGFERFDTSGVVDLRALALAAERHVDAVLATRERDILRAARLRARLGLPGQSVASALAYRNKLVMKGHLAAAGVAVAPFRPVASTVDLLDFADQWGYLLVVKPAYGSGSTGTTVVTDRRELEALVARGLSAHSDIDPTLMVERFVPGPMYSVEGLILDGEIHFSWPSSYINGALAFRHGVVHGTATLTAAHPLRGRLQRFASEVVRALPSPGNAAFHAEVFHTPDDQLVLCEIASRAGGGRITAALAAAFDLDLNEVAFRAQVGLPLRGPVPTGAEPRRLTAWLMIPPRADLVVSLPPRCPLPAVISYEGSPPPGGRCGAAQVSTDAVAVAVLEAGSEGALTDAVAEFASWSAREVRWTGAAPA
jgi:hypothetical protein